MDLAELRTSLQNHGYGTDTVDQQTSFLNSAYREIHGAKRWPFLETVDSSQSTVEGTSVYTPPMAAWRNVDAVRIALATDATLAPHMEYREPQWLLDRLHADPDNRGAPNYWSMYGQQIYLWPTPDDVYTITYYYITEPADLSADDDVPVIPVPYHDAIVAGAICRIAFRERDWIGLELWQTKYDTLVQKLSGEYLLTQRQTAQRVQKSGVNRKGPRWNFPSGF